MILSKNIKVTNKKNTITDEDIKLYKERIEESFSNNMNNIFENNIVKEIYYDYLENMIEFLKKKDELNTIYDIRSNPNDMIFVQECRTIEPLNKFINNKIKNFQIIRQPLLN